MTTANHCFHAPVTGFAPPGTLGRLACATRETLAEAWAGLQSVSRASMLDAARARRADAGSSARIRRLP